MDLTRPFGEVGIRRTKKDDLSGTVTRSESQKNKLQNQPEGDSLTKHFIKKQFFKSKIRIRCSLDKKIFKFSVILNLTKHSRHNKAAIYTFKICKTISNKGGH